MDEKKIASLITLSDHFIWMVREGFRRCGRFPGEVFLLRAVCESDGGHITPSQVSCEMRMSPPTISPIIARLEDQGLLVRLPSQSDRRRTYLKATPRGQKMYEGTRKKLLEYYRGLAGALTPEELDLFLMLLDKISAARKEGRRC